MYDLDRVSQLLRSTDGFDVERFTWDAAGNLLDESHRASDGRIAPLMDNLLRRYNGVQYVHDDWGQVIRRDWTKLTSDAEGHLLSSTTDQAHATYRYDALGRRIGKRVERFGMHGFAPDSQVRETCFVWEGLRLAQERESTGITRTYVYDPVRAYAPVARVDRTIGDAQEKVWYYHTDPAGTARLVTDAQGRVVWSGSYTAWGKVRANLADAAAFVQPLRMPGQYHDEESGLHYNTFRYYDPHAGRFVSADPIGLAGGLNLYAYVPNPLTWIDPLGLMGEDLTSRAARREAMRQVGIPTSQQTISQSKNASGWEYRYEVQQAGGGRIEATVQQQTMDVSHRDAPHWEAGKVKVDPISGETRMSDYGRPKIANPKGKAYYGTC